MQNGELPQSPLHPTVNIEQLKRGQLWLSALRKPDFQRETAAWSPKKIANFIQTFLNGELIPAVIMWRSKSNNIFVIDGSHRLSALIAWVHIDYGAGELSYEFFRQQIPADQQKAANATRDLVNKQIGPFQEFLSAGANPKGARPEIITRALSLASLGLPLQWIAGDDSVKAEQSFFRINQEAVPIDKTELRILRTRRCPNAVAARAIVRQGTGHKYWSKFSDEEIKTEIEELAQSIYRNLFEPEIDSPIKTLDLPIGGRGFSAQTLPLIYDFVNFANDIPLKETKSIKPDLPVDNDGTETVKYLKKVERLTRRISGLHPSSLGLHPAVYFYGANGRYQPTPFLAMVTLIKRWQDNDYFDTFTKHRAEFENYILRHKNFANEVVQKGGSGVKSYARLAELYSLILERIVAGDNDDQVWTELSKRPYFANLRQTFNLQELEEGRTRRGKREFSDEVKSYAFLRNALQGAPTCEICKARIHVNSITTDHIIRKQDGGLGVADNAQISHPYCNTTYKN